VQLPNLEVASVPSEKVIGYLLNLAHEEGHGKARFFIHFGFSVAQWHQLAFALLRHASDHQVVKQISTRFGTNYVIEGMLHTPSLRTPLVRVVWFIAYDDDRPRLITAYPLEADND
jgi:hypothetical protein